MIGISNVSADQLRLLCERAVQNPWSYRIVATPRWAGIGTCGTSAGHRGSSIRVLVAHSQPDIFADPELRVMAAKYGMGLAQLVFRFAMQVGMLPLTGTTNQQHMTEDLRSDQFTISAEDLQRLETIGM